MRNSTKLGSSQDTALYLLYHTRLGRMCLKVLTQPIMSKVVACFMNSIFSAFLIEPFIHKNHIKMSDYEPTRYRSYNEFFTRKIRSGKRSFPKDSACFMSPCDSKLSIYPIDDKSLFTIKNSCYSLSSLLLNKGLAKEYEGGYCLIFRLTVDDYHRYCYIDDGTKSNNVFIPGVLHTVNPIALDLCNIYHQNAREYTILHTKHFKDIVQVEVGAMLVGKIRNHHDKHTFSRGEEKGMFEFGGSTIILLVKEAMLNPYCHILRNTQLGFETVVKMGQTIGHK